MKTSFVRWIFCVALILCGSLAAVTAQTRHTNGKIAFTSDRDGNREIYVMNPDGSDQVRLTNNTNVDDSAVWSPDGREIAFVSEKQNGRFAIFRMKADGTGRAEITELNNSSWADWGPLSWSPDGRRIAFHDSSGASTGLDIFVVNSGGGRRRNLTMDGNSITPIWSPDARKILFSRYGVYGPGYGGTMLHTIDIDGTNLTPLENGFAHGWNEDLPDWSRVTNKIVYSVNIWDFYFDLYTANPDGTGRQFFHHCPSGCDAFDPTFSPNGRTIVFECWQFYPSNLSTQIFSRNTDGTEPRQLTNTGGHNSNPSWQPIFANTTGDGDREKENDHE